MIQVTEVLGILAQLYTHRVVTLVRPFSSMRPLVLLEATQLVELAPTTLEVTDQVRGSDLVHTTVRTQAVW